MPSPPEGSNFDGETKYSDHLTKITDSIIKEATTFSKDVNFCIDILINLSCFIELFSKFQAKSGLLPISLFLNIYHSLIFPDMHQNYL